MARLFEAYFRVAGEAGRERLEGGSLPLDLPTDGGSRHYFRAEFTRDRRWVVEVSRSASRARSGQAKPLSHLGLW